MSQHKDEAIRTLEQVRERLRSDETLGTRGRLLLAADVEYALSELAQVEEIKRARPKAKPVTPPDGGEA